ncbi:MAG: HAMP domain-containing protein [Planctomycetaceae bacterium]|nr:HAMP domain-containing protein [Planctomycetaceae bacterium]
MSYRTLKRLLGETSLERKCRFLFGGAFFILISSSFYIYGKLTADIVEEQNLRTGRTLVAPAILERHWQALEAIDDPQFAAVVDTMSRELEPVGLDRYQWDLFSAESSDPEKRPHGQEEFSAFRKIKFEGATEDIQIFPEKDGELWYHYYCEVRATKICLTCHHSGVPPDAAEGHLMGMAMIRFPRATTEKSLVLNNAMLMATAIGTAILAMVAAYAIVRYVIVKPVLHLKEVSDAISRGNLERRADIRTGDEFEELSQAFNRMLRHLVAVQEELRQVNGALDNKVDELAQVNMQLFELNNLKNDFMATMSHELRTPLNSILGFSDVLTGSENLNEKQQRYLRNIQTSGRDLLTLINDILDLAKIEAGKMDLHIVEFSIADLAERLVGMMRPLAEKRNIALTCEVDPRVPLLVQDMGKIQQILVNLLSNAIKFTPEGGRVQMITSLRDEKRLELQVEDTGVGIPLEDQESIFEKFRQGNRVRGAEPSTLTREYAGTGLGLSIVRELSKLLGGEVSLMSELGKGSRFTVVMPLVLKEQPRLLAEILARPLAGVVPAREEQPVAQSAS